MAENMSSVRLIECLATTDSLAEVFSNQSVLQAMLDFEVALARAAARADIVPEAVAAAIAAAAEAKRFDVAAIAREARQSATPVIPLVGALTERVRAIDPESAQYVHWGATSQDVADTAMVLLLKRAKSLLAADHARIDRALRTLSEAHASTVMLGRTLLQPATPITFGLKAAGWCAALSRSWSRLSAAWHAALVLEFGGAAGTRAAFGDRAAIVAMELATELDLGPAPPWHTDRDRLGGAIAAMGLYTAVLGKIARDVSLLMQAEVGEVAERGGGSSSMPHKRNPVGLGSGDRGGDADAGSGGRLPHRDGAGARAFGRREPGGMANDRVDRADHRIGGCRGGGCPRGAERQHVEDAGESGRDGRGHLRGTCGRRARTSRRAGHRPATRHRGRAAEPGVGPFVPRRAAGDARARRTR